MRKTINNLNELNFTINFIKKVVENYFKLKIYLARHQCKHEIYINHGIPLILGQFIVQHVVFLVLPLKFTNMFVLTSSALVFVFAV